MTAKEEFQYLFDEILDRALEGLMYVYTITQSEDGKFYMIDCEMDYEQAFCLKINEKKSEEELVIPHKSPFKMKFARDMKRDVLPMITERYLELAGDDEEWE